MARMALLALSALPTAGRHDAVDELTAVRAFNRTTTLGGSALASLVWRPPVRGRGES